MRASYTTLRTFLPVSAILLVSTAAPGPTRAQCAGNGTVKLLPSDGAGPGEFGHSVSLSGNVAVVGAWRDDENGALSGSAYVFRYDANTAQWFQETKLLPVDVAAGDEFGYSVGISGHVAVVGAWRDDENGALSGSAYVFRYDANTAQWLQEAKLLPADGVAGDEFGQSVAISGNVAVVGAFLDDSGSGSVYVFRYDATTAQWSEQQKLVSLDIAQGDKFGGSVSVWGDLTVIGAWKDTHNGLRSGSAYVFRYDLGTKLWIEEAKLLAMDGALDDYFGFSVHVSSNVALIGAWRDQDNGEYSGSAYVFRYDASSSTWNQEAKLLASDGSFGQFFGSSVSTNGKLALIGAYGDDSLAINSGSAYLFRYAPSSGNWNEETKLRAFDGGLSDQFGWSVSLSDATAAVGARLDQDSGSVYIINGLSDCNNNEVSDICDIADGTSLDVNGNGIPDECELDEINEQTKLTASDVAASDAFGSSVSISGDRAVIGVHGDDCEDGSSNCGSAYLFRFDGTNWIEEDRVTADDGQALDFFGAAVSISGDRAIIRSAGGIAPPDPFGSVYVFRRDNNGSPSDPDDDFWVQEAKLNALDQEASDNFGYALSISGDWVVVGARFDGGGSAYVFRRDDNGTPSDPSDDFWVQEAKLTADNAAGVHLFGWSVAIGGNRITVGARGDECETSPGACGAAYVFLRNDNGTPTDPNDDFWLQEDKLAASDGAPGDAFGASVSIFGSGNWAIVGAYRDDDACPDDPDCDSGSAYVFRREGTNWVQQAKLTAVDGAALDLFSWSVSITEDQAIVGTRVDEAVPRFGSAYVFQRNDKDTPSDLSDDLWVPRFKLTASDEALDDLFAHSVSISGNLAICGARRDDCVAGNNCGAVYVFNAPLCNDGSCSPGENPCNCATDCQPAQSPEADCTDGVDNDCDGLVDCDDPNCAIADACKGACCRDITMDAFQYDTCEVTDAPNCQILAGLFQGIGTTCTTEACCLPGGSCADIDPLCCEESGGVPQGPTSVCQGDIDGNGIDDTCPTGTCNDCGPGDHWIDTCPEGNDNFPSGAMVAIDLNLDCMVDTTLVLQGPVTISRAAAQPDHTILTEIVQMSLTGGGVTLRSGSGTGVGPQGGFLAPTLGQIVEKLDPTIGASSFDVFFEVDLGAGLYGYNQEPLVVSAQITCIPPNQLYTHPVGTCIPLFSSPVIGEGTVIANIVSANHQPLPGCGDGACDAANGENFCNCPVDCDIPAGGSSDCNGNGVPDACDIANGASEDCNGNDVPDECDIADGTIEDLDGNDIPDECEVCQVHEDTKLTASDPEAADEFGYSVSISGNVALVGARYVDCGDGVNCGAAYIYHFDGTSWTNETKLTSFDESAFSRFGSSVSISGDVAVIGAPRDGNTGLGTPARGSAYVYRFDGMNWGLEDKLGPTDPTDVFEFGISVSVDGDVIVVGAWGDDHAGNASGSAFVFRYNSTTQEWEEEQKLTDPNANAFDEFGVSVSVSGDVAVVGDHRDDDAGNVAGSAFIYRFDGAEWLEQAKLIASDAATLDEFGYSVSVSGNLAVIGARFDDDSGPESGSAYVYRFDGTAWVEETKLTAFDGAEGDWFGVSVAVDGDVAVIGAKQRNIGAPGSAYVYRFDGAEWIEQAKLTALVPREFDLFGHTVSVSNNSAFIGALWDDDVVTNSGSAFVFDLTDLCPVCGNGDCTPSEPCKCAVDCGTPPLTETPSSCDDDLDNDCDELVDCDDSDCAIADACKGACCRDITMDEFQYDTCEVTDEASCQSQGGLFQGVGTTCTTVACCLPSGSCADIDPRCCVDSGGTPRGGGIVCAGDNDGNDVDDACQPDEPCEGCGLVAHWVDTCPAGADFMPSQALVGIDLDGDCQADTTLILSGPVDIQHGPGDPVNHRIDAEIVSMNLTGGGVTLRAGAILGLQPSIGQIVEQMGDSTMADSQFNVFFEVTGDGLPGPVYNHEAVQLGSTIDCLPPKTTYVHDQTCIPLYDSPIPGQGTVVAHLVSASHTTFPSGACCLPDGSCQEISVEDCTQQGGTPRGVGSVCAGDNDGNGVDDTCQPNEPCDGCGLVSHWVDTCPAGNDFMPSQALVGIDVTNDCQADTTLILSGPVDIQHGPGDPVNHRIDAEIVSMNLTGGGVTLRAGAILGLQPSIGQIVEQMGDSTMADSQFNVFFEVTGDGLPGPVYNHEAVQLGSTIDCLPPKTTYVHDQSCIPLYDSPIPGQGTVVAHLVSASHTTFPTGACCLPDGSCQEISVEDCTQQGGTPLGVGSVCTGDNDGNGVDDACKPIPVCDGCGLVAHWVDTCPAGADFMPSQALVGIDLDGDCQADTTLILSGPVNIQHGPGDPVTHTIDAEIVSMNLTGGGVTLRAGAILGLQPSIGQIVEQMGDSTMADSQFDVFFEVTGDGLSGPVYNHDAFQVSSTIDCLPPKTTYVHDQTCIPLYDSPIPGQGTVVAHLVSASHTTFPTGACCLPDGSCQEISVEDCTQQGGTPLGVGSVCEDNDVIFDISFDASSDFNSDPQSFQVPARGRFRLVLSNPDASADGGVKVLIRGQESLLQLLEGHRFGYTGAPAYNGVTIVGQAQRVFEISVNQAIVGAGELEYFLDYRVNRGSENVGTNRVRLEYIPSEIVIPVGDPLLSITSGSHETNSVTIPFDAETSGVLLVEHTDISRGGGGHEIYVDGLGYGYSVHTPPHGPPVYYTVEVSAGEHELRVAHNDDFFLDNDGIRSVNVFFLQLPILACCGDGFAAASEACDDGNNENGDGCSASCTVEPGFECTCFPSVCGLCPCPGDDVIFDISFDASASLSLTIPDLYQIPNPGRFRLILMNPDGSADGAIAVLVKNGSATIGVLVGYLYGYTKVPAYNGVTQQGQRLRVFDISINPPLVEAGALEYTLLYNTNQGSQNRGMNRVRLEYIPSELLIPDYDPLVSIFSNAMEANSVTVQFDAQTSGILLVDHGGVAFGGGGHEIYVDGLGYGYSQYFSSSSSPKRYAVEVSAGPHELRVAHNDDFFPDNTGTRGVDVYFLPQARPPCCDGPDTVEQTQKFCISGSSDGGGYSWSLSGPTFLVQELSALAPPDGSGPVELAAAFVDSINSVGFPDMASVDAMTPNCFDVTICAVEPFDLNVGLEGNPNDCCVTCPANLVDGCPYNPTIRVVPDTIPTVSDWGLVIITLLLLTGMKLKFGRRRAAQA